MVFPSVQFAVFFPAVLALSWLLMPRPALWKPFIIVASYAFYAAAEPRFCLLLGRRDARQPARRAADRPHRATSAARKLDRRRRPSAFDLLVARRLQVLRLLRRRTSTACCDDVGLGAPLPLLTIALPVGVSFFTFQAISYIVDVKPRPVRARRDASTSRST